MRLACASLPAICTALLAISLQLPVIFAVQSVAIRPQPAVGIEPTSNSLQDCCLTVRPCWQIVGIYEQTIHRLANMLPSILWFLCYQQLPTDSHRLVRWQPLCIFPKEAIERIAVTVRYLSLHHGRVDYRLLGGVSAGFLAFLPPFVNLDDSALGGNHPYKPPWVLFCLSMVGYPLRSPKRYGVLIANYTTTACKCKGYRTERS